MATTVTSKRFSLNLSDGMKSFLVAVLSPVFAIIMTSLNAGSFEFDWHTIWVVAASSALGYITKNFLQRPTIVITNPDAGSMQAVKDGAEAKVMSN